MSSSECSRDQPSIVFEDQLETEKECVALCQTYASISVIGCTFAAWEAGVVLGKCTLYKESFANYLAHCQLLAGPPDVSGCSVDHPAENSCDGIRFLCILRYESSTLILYKELSSPIFQSCERVRASGIGNTCPDLHFSQYIKA